MTFIVSLIIITSFGVISAIATLSLYLKITLQRNRRNPANNTLTNTNFTSRNYLIMPQSSESPQNSCCDDENDFYLEIPEGATKESNTPTILLGVALFGQFKFPEGLRPVSPVFWVCVEENPIFKFFKPVSVTLPHFLDLENDDDIRSLGLTFLKADHKKNLNGLYEFQPTDGEMDFKTYKTHGSLQTTHFCSLCVAARDIPSTLANSRFCITAVIPRYSVPVGQSVTAYFFITFLRLKTCLTKVDTIIEKMGLKHNYRIKREPFKFRTWARVPSLEMIVHCPKYGDIGVVGKKKVYKKVTQSSYSTFFADEVKSNYSDHEYVAMLLFNLYHRYFAVMWIFLSKEEYQMMNWSVCRVMSFILHDLRFSFHPLRKILHLEVARLPSEEPQQILSLTPI